MITPIRPVCRYYGGKWRIADWIIGFFPPHKTYVEPFGGAASVLLKKKPVRSEIYNDLSDEMVNLFRVLRDPIQSKELRRLLDLTPYSRTEWLSCYELSDDPIEQARRTVVLAMMSHNPSKVMMRQANGFRTSSSGHHQLPIDFQNHTESLELITKRLKSVVIENRNAIDLMRQHDRETTLHYVDPPYFGETRSDKYSRYQHEALSEEKHLEISKILNNLKGFVLLSGYECPQYTEWYENKGWISFKRKAVTGAAVPGKSNRVEVVWLNPKIADYQKQLSLFNQ